jgi:Trypsin-like peptidase domain
MSDEPDQETRLTPAELYSRYGNCVVRVQVTSKEGDLANGTAFHIGGGAYVTARHVVEGKKDITLFRSDTGSNPKDGYPVYEVLEHPERQIDLAILLSDLNREVFGDHAAPDPPRDQQVSFISLPEMWGEWITDAFLLTKGMICGYPRVPFARYPTHVVVSAEINVQFDRYDQAAVHFIVSSTARGGFSGAPLISEFDFVLGVVTEEISEQPESPFMAVIAIEPLYEIIKRNETHLKGRLKHFLASWSARKDENGT